jgi:hypothetical protein
MRIAVWPPSDPVDLDVAELHVAQVALELSGKFDIRS